MKTKIYSTIFFLILLGQYVSAQEISFINTPLNEKKNNAKNDFFKIGIESFENENFELALENFELNIELNKIHLPSYFYKALTLKKMKKYDESLKSFSEIIKLDGTFYTTYFHMAEIMIEFKVFK